MGGALYIIESPYFEPFIMAIICANVFTLALHDPLLGDHEGTNEPLFQCDLSWTAVFSVEMILKMVAYGVSPKANYLNYLNDPWNWFDMSMVAIGWTLLLPAQTGSNTNGIRAIRALRALRPLRTISRFDSLRFVLECFFASLPLLGAVFALLAVFLYVYATIGLFAFHKIYHLVCVSDDNVTMPSTYGLYETQIITYDDPDMAGCSRWRKCDPGFTCMEVPISTQRNTAGYDHFGLSLLTTYQALTLTGWDFMMYRAMDSSSPFALIYYISLVITGAYFVMNLFIAVLKMQFTKAQRVKAREKPVLKKKLSQQGTMTSSFSGSRIEKWYKRVTKRMTQTILVEEYLQGMLQQRALTAPLDDGMTMETTAREFDQFVWAHPTRWAWLLRLQFRMRALTQHFLFTYLMLFCIWGTFVVLAIEYDGISDDLQTALINTNYAFVATFVFEVSAGMTAFGPVAYLSDAWNIFDFILTAVALGELGAESQGGLDIVRTNHALRVVRSMRVARLLKLFKHSQGLQDIGVVLLASAPSFSAISILVLLFWVVFGIVGMNVFGGIGMDQAYPNFDTFISSILISFQVLTLENYQQTMYSVIRATNYASCMWFVTWILFGKYIFLSLFLTVVLEAFDDRGEPEAPSEYDASTMPRETSVYKRMKTSVIELKRGFQSLADFAHVIKLATPPTQSTATSFTGSGSRSLSGGKPTPRSRRHRPRPAQVPLLRRRRRQPLRAEPQQRGRPPEPTNSYSYPLCFLGPGLSYPTSTHFVIPLNAPTVPAPSLLPAHLLTTDATLSLELRVAAMEAQISLITQGAPDQHLPGLIRGDSGRVAQRNGAHPLQDAGDDVGGVGGGPAGSSDRSMTRPVTPSVPQQLPKQGSSKARASPPEHPVPNTLDDSQPEEPSTRGGQARRPAPGRRSGQFAEPPPRGARESVSGQGAVAVARQQSSGSRVQAAGEESTRVSAHTTHKGSAPAKQHQSPAQAGDNRGSLSLQDGRAMSRANSAAAGRQSPATLLQASVRSSGVNRPLQHPPPALLRESSTGIVIGTPRSGPGGSSAEAEEWYQGTTHRAPQSQPQPRSARGQALGEGTEPSSSSSSRDPNPQYRDPLLQGDETAFNLDAAGTLSQQGRDRGGSSSPSPALQLSGIGQHNPTHLPPIKPSACDHSTGQNQDPCPQGPSLDGMQPRSHEATDITQVAQARTAAQTMSPFAIQQMSKVGHQPTGAALPTLTSSADLSARPPVSRTSSTCSSQQSHAAHTVLSVQGPNGRTQSALSRQPESPARSSKSYRPNQVLPGPVEFGIAVDARPPSREIQSNPGKPKGALNLVPSGSVQDVTALARASSVRSEARSVARTDSMRASQTSQQASEYVMEGRSLGLFSATNPMRVKAFKLVSHKAFDWTLVAIITLNCIALAVENPGIRAGSPEDLALYYSDIIFTIIFTVEAMIKIVGWGFRQYIRRIPNMIDLLIVVTSLLELALRDLPWFHALRVLRALKPLRMLTHSAGMQQVFRSVLIALSSMGAVTAICLLSLLIFGVLGVQLFNGRFWSCNDGISNQANCNGTYFDNANMTQNQAWTNLYPNFDNLGNALIVLFITTTTNGYSPYMIAAMNSPNIKGDAPARNQNWGSFFYFMAFVLICALILLNLYTGVIFSQFAKIAEQNMGSAWLTEEQQQWVALQEAVFRLQPLQPNNTLPKNPWRRWLYSLVQHRYFEYLMGVVIAGNCVVVSMTQYGQSQALTEQLAVANYVFVCVFIVEMLLKVAGMGFGQYWKEAWNRLDFLIVVAAIIDLGVDYSYPTVFKAMHIFAIERSIRVLKLGRLLDQFRTVKALSITFIVAMPAFLNIGSLIFLILFIYAYVGVLIFGKLMWGQSLNMHANFTTWWKAMLLLVRLATGDNWSDIWIDLIPQFPARCDGSQGECGSWLAIPYIVSFMLIIYDIFLNLFMAVIIEAYERMALMAEWKVSPQMLDELVWAWVEHDDGTHSIPPQHLRQVLEELPPPLGLGYGATADDLDAFARELNIPLVDGRLPFHATVYELVRRCGETNLPDDLLVKTVLEQKYRMMVGQHTNRPLANLRQSFVDQKGTAARKAGDKPRALDPISSLQDEVKQSIASDPKIRLAQSSGSANLDFVLGTAIAPQDSEAMTEAPQPAAAAARSGEVGGPARSSAALHHPTHLEPSPSFGSGAHAAHHRRAHKPLVVL
ncbi:MAG: hypothetical protein WDW36_003317 [Sanguina aurantia]